MVDRPKMKYLMRNRGMDTLCEGNPLMTVGFPSQGASNVEFVSSLLPV